METVAAGAVLLMLFAATCVIPVAVAVVALSVVRQARFRRPGTPVSPLVAEAMTRRAINDARIMIVVSSAVVAALYVTGDECYAVLVAFIPILRVLRLILAHRFLDYIETHVGPVTLHSNLLAVHCDRYIVVPPSVARGALMHAVPAAISRG
jgi:hypothetical protein